MGRIWKMFRLGKRGTHSGREKNGELLMVFVMEEASMLEYNATCRRLGLSRLGLVRLQWMLGIAQALGQTRSLSRDLEPGSRSAQVKV